ncbi:hypothetical protein FACS1894201_04090 [Bacteroidia bacterium]|nr:hypothetical protein FACS1894201_04090 [Bacteroidia bacterium]
MKKIIFTFLGVSILFVAVAQDLNEQVTVVAPYQPKLTDVVYKINRQPQTLDTTFKTGALRYDIISRKVITSFGTENIKPARVAGEPIEKLSPLHARAGYGNYKTPYAELFVGSLRSQKWQGGAHLKHRSSQSTIEPDDDDNAPYIYDNSVNQAELFGSLVTDKVQLSSMLYFNRNRFSILQDTGYPVSPKRIYSNMGINLNLEDNMLDPTKFRHKTQVNINYLNANVNFNEIGIEVSTDIGKQYDFGDHFSETFIGFSGEVNMHGAVCDSLSFNSNTIKLQPYVSVNLKNHRFKIGLKFNTYSNDSRTERYMKMQLAPVLDFRFNLVPSVFAVYLGMDGDVNQYTYRYITKSNPFLDYRLSTTFDYKPDLQRQYYAGISTAVSKRLNLKLQSTFVTYQNLCYFYGTTGLSAFDPSYGIISPTPRVSYRYVPAYITEKTISCVQLQGDLSYQWDEKFSTHLMGRFNYYDQQVPYRPIHEMTLDLRYSMQDKIIIKSQLMVGGDFYTNVMNEEKLNKTMADWSIDVEYRFNKQFSAFADFNNILNQRNYLWEWYPTYRFNFLVGLSFTL